MSDWIEQYSAGLAERDAREQAHKSVIDAYTRLADRVAATQAPSPPPSAVPPSSPQPAGPSSRSSTPSKSTRTKDNPSQPPPPPATNTDLLTSLRTDLAATQKARTTLQSTVDSLTTTLSTLRAETSRSTTQITLLQKTKAELERRVRDRDEELRGKSKMVQQAHDEMVAMELQLNVAEQKAQRLERENRELVERWMRRVGEEAEGLNRESKWE